VKKIAYFLGSLFHKIKGKKMSIKGKNREAHGA
jgi:hypothetical protein